MAVVTRNLSTTASPYNAFSAVTPKALAAPVARPASVPSPAPAQSPAPAAAPGKATSPAASPYNSFNAGSADAASLGAANADFLGEGGVADAAKAPDKTAADNAVLARLKLRNDATATANANAGYDRTASQGSTPAQMAAANAAGNIGGAAGAYNAANDSGKAQYDYMHDLGKNDSFISGRTLLNRMGEDVGVSHVGDVSNPADFSIQNPLDFNPTAAAMNPDKGLGTTVGSVGGATAGKPVTNLSTDTRAAANIGSQGILPTGAGAVGDALDNVMGGPGEMPFDTSGGDRGGMGDYSGVLGAAQAQSAGARQLGQDVLSGKVGGANPADANRQSQVLGKAGAYAPAAQQGVMGQVNAFTQQPEGPSQAEIQLQQQSGKNMSDALALARSGRARDAGSQARALNVAMAENAQTGAETNQQAALLRANEAATKRQQDLSALGLSGQLASGIDTSKLSALNLQGDLASQMRSASDTERGQTLGFTQGMEQTGAATTGDVLKTIPQIEQVRHSDQFDLTPQQKLAAAKIGNPDKTTADYITGLLGDVLSAI